MPIVLAVFEVVFSPLIGVLSVVRRTVVGVWGIKAI